MTANPQETQAELEAKRRGRCDSCQRNVEWIARDERYALVRLDAADRPEVSSDEALPLQVLMCPNCGFARLYVLPV
jgi:hypothetical protein